MTIRTAIVIHLLCNSPAHRPGSPDTSSYSGRSEDQAIAAAKAAGWEFRTTTMGGGINIETHHCRRCAMRAAGGMQ